MRIMDKIFGKKKEESAASLSKKTETVDPYIEVATRIDQRNQSPTVQNIDNIVQEEARKLKLEIAKKERQQAADYDFFVCNDTIESAVNQLIDILNK